MIKYLRSRFGLGHTGPYMESSSKIKLFNPVSRMISRGMTPVLDIVLPSADLLDPVQSSPEWLNMRYLDEPCCMRCGYPFEYQMIPGQDCAKCSVSPPVFDQARSALQYHEDSCGLILSFKHGGRTANLARFCRQMVRAGRRFWTETDVILPVPLHASRLKQRKFNQAALLARKIGRLTQIPYDPDILRRHRATASQGTKTAKGRFRNVRGAFSVPEDKRADLKDKTVVIIDDVYTTGATLEACTRALKRAGAARVFVLTLARVVRDQEIPT